VPYSSTSLGKHQLRVLQIKEGYRTFPLPTMDPQIETLKRKEREKKKRGKLEKLKKLAELVIPGK
jgi:hypothetical protein